MYATKEEAVAAAPKIEGIDWASLWDRFGGLIVSLLISVLLKVNPTPTPMQGAMGHCDDHCDCIKRLCCIIDCAQEEIKCHCDGCCNKP